MISKKKKHFTEEQIEFLTNRNTLAAWATKSLSERVMLFKRRFPMAAMTVYKLRKLYAEKRIKKKIIRKTKIADRATLEKITLQANDLANDVRMASERGFRIIQLDECYVTKNTLQSNAWAIKRENIDLDYKQLQLEVKAIIAAVSRENGLDHMEVFRHSTTKIKFKLFLEGLRRKFPFDDIILVMDQLSLHKAADVKELMDELGFLYTYTPVYSPAYNGIEEVFSLGKGLIKARRLQNLIDGAEENMTELIKSSFNSINTHHIAKCVGRSLELLGLFPL